MNMKPLPPLDLDSHPEVYPFFDKATNTVTYIVRDPANKSCAIIDSVLDIDYAAGAIDYVSAKKVIDKVRELDLTVEWIIETHVHADHLSAAPYLQQVLGGKLGIGEHIIEVQDTFGKIFNEGTEFQRDGSQFDQLFADGDTYKIGTLIATVLHTPGHTPACTTHVIGDAAFVGDTFFMPDGGTGRTDFPGGNARDLYRSMTRVLTLPDQVRVFVCHDYGPNGRDIKWETTIGEERSSNVHLLQCETEDDYVKLRETRDATLSAPKLIIPSLQVNMRAGNLPQDDDGNVVLKVPINRLTGS
jgi:glyoxylase-like metal-dependent hydrolase (beta-lactamase superfamily II)